MVVDPFTPRLCVLPTKTLGTVIHVRSESFSDSRAAFIPQTVYGLIPYYRNIVIATDFDCQPNDQVVMIKMSKKELKLSERVNEIAYKLNMNFGDIVAVVGHFGNGMKMGHPLAKALNVPIMGIFGGSDVNVGLSGVLDQRFQDILKDKTAYFMTVASYLSNKITQAGAPEARTFAWRRGVDLKQFRPEFWAVRRAESKLVRIVMAGRFIEVKGHEYAIRGFSEAAKQCPNIQLELYGEGPGKAKMQSLVSELNMHNKVQFHGQVDRNQLIEALGNAQIGLLSSVRCIDGKSEGIPNVLVESQAMALPVIATTNGGIPEVVIDGVTGKLVPERDYSAIAMAIIKLAENENLRQKMGRAAREYMEAEFNRDRQAIFLAAKIRHMSLRAELISQRIEKNIYRDLNIVYPSPESQLFLGVSPIKHGEYESAYRERAKMRKKIEEGQFEACRNDSLVGLCSYWCARVYKLMAGVLVFPLFLTPAGRRIKKLSKFLPAYLYDLRMQLSRQQKMVLNHDLSIEHIENRLSTKGMLDYTQGNVQLVQTMSQAQCPYCPYANLLQGVWSDDPCPLDVKCMEALEMEGRGKSDVLAQFVDLDSGVVTFRDESFADGEIKKVQRNSLKKIRCIVHMQFNVGVNDILGEIGRILSGGGELELVVWPMTKGSCGTKLYGDIPIPFAQYIFNEEVIKQYLGVKELNMLKCVTPENIDLELTRLGFVGASDQMFDEEYSLCTLEFQARFGAALSKLEGDAVTYQTAYVRKWMKS